MYLKKYKNKYKSFRSDQSSVWTKKQPRMENQLPAPVLAFKDKGYLFKKYLEDYRTIEEFSKAYFPTRNQKVTEAPNSMMRLLSLEHLSYQIWSKQLGVTNH